MSQCRFEYYAPETLEEAVDLLIAKGPGAVLMAGGTDLMVKVRHGALAPPVIVALKKIGGLDAIGFDRQAGLSIGATALLADVAAHPAVRRRYPAVAKAAACTANVQIRNMGTVVGNLCNASPSADNAPMLLVMEAEMEIVGPEGRRRMPLRDFFRGPGHTVLETAEIAAAVHVPVPPPGSGAAYQPISARSEADCAAVNVGAMVTLEGATCRRAAVAVGACAPVPMRAHLAEKRLVGRKLTAGNILAAARETARETRPITDVRASAAYRWKMVEVMTARALNAAAKQARRAKRG